MSFTNFQKTIALSGGVLVLSGAIAFIVFAAWTGPTAEPPSGNAPAPLNTGDLAQTKTGDLTVGNLSLDDAGNEGDIRNADEIIGYNDLQLRADAAGQAKIGLSEGGDGSIKFYTGGEARMAVGADGNLYVALDGLPCFLEATDTGKVRCYTGGGIPGGNVLETTQVLVASAVNEDWTILVCDTYTILAADVEKVVRVYFDIVTTHAYQGQVWFYINGVLTWEKKCVLDCSTWNASRYYHVKAGDQLKVCARKDSTQGHYAATIYTLGAKRELITHAFAEGPKILYWYDQAVTGEMSPAGAHYIGPDPTVSVIISAKDSEQVKWIID